VITEQPIGWLMAIVTVWTVAVLFILLTLAVIGPTLWREGLALLRELLGTRRSNVVDLDEERRRLRAASGERL
jgi:hypothetical protein